MKAYLIVKHEELIGFAPVIVTLINDGTSCKVDYKEMVSVKNW